MAHRGPRRVSATSGEDSCESSPLQLAGRSRVTRVQRVLSEETLEAVSSDPRRENGRLRQLLRVENAALAKIKDRVTQDVGSILYGTGRRGGGEQRDGVLGRRGRKFNHLSIGLSNWRYCPGGFADGFSV